MKNVALSVFRRQAVVVSTLTAELDKNSSLLAITANGDEAGRALGAVDMVGEILSRLMTFVAGVTKGTLGMLALPLFYIPLKAITQIDFLFGGPDLTIFFILFLVFASLPILYVLFHVPLLCSYYVRRLSYWDDSPFDYAHTRLFVETYPSGAWDHWKSETIPNSRGTCAYQVFAHDLAFCRVASGTQRFITARKFCRTSLPGY